MKRWRLLIGALVAFALIAFGVRHVLEKRAQRKREVGYETTLRSYSEVFKPGMTRKQLEDYLSAKGTPFRQMCCVSRKEFGKGVYDDLVKVGQEDAPWFCSEQNIYVAFQFIGPERHSVGPAAEASDTLNSVSVYRWLEGCL